jgi:uncharacterized membrane protein
MRTSPGDLMAALIAGLALFLAVHSLGLFGLREPLVARVGVRAYRALYSLVSIAGFVLLLKGFALARGSSPVLYDPPAAFHYATLVLMLPVFPLLLATYLPGAIQRRLRHPTLLAVKVWAFAHLLANGRLADVLLFGGFLAWAVALRVSYRTRPARTVSPVPAWPINDLLAVALGLLLYIALVMGLHERLFGLAPLSGL